MDTTSWASSLVSLATTREKQIKEGTVQPALVRLKSIGNDEPVSVQFMTAYSPRPGEYSMKVAFRRTANLRFA